MTENTNDKESFWWIFEQHPLPWHTIVMPSGGYVFFDKNDKIVHGDLISKCINEMDTSMHGCPLCGESR